MKGKTLIGYYEIPIQFLNSMRDKMKHDKDCNLNLVYDCSCGLLFLKRELNMIYETEPKTQLSPTKRSVKK